jgi:hypothetical protein
MSPSGWPRSSTDLPTSPPRWAATRGDDVLRRRVVEYFDWGTKIAREVSAVSAGTDLGDPGPTPRWGWNGVR